MFRVLVLVLTLAVFGCGNESYKKDIEKQLKPILKHSNTKYEDIIDYLEDNKLRYHEIQKEDCIESTYGDFSLTCEYPLYIFVRIPIKKWLNPVQSTGKVYLFLNDENVLVQYKIKIGHTFL